MKPPVLADWLLRLLVPRHLQSDILGDLHEEYRRFTLNGSGQPQARLRYWRQVLMSPIHYSVARRHIGLKPMLQRGVSMAHILQDLRFALRSLRRRPLFFGVALLTLGLGIGGATAVFSVVDGVLLRDLPYADADRVVSLWKASHSLQGQTTLWDRVPYDYQQYLDLRLESTLLDDVSVYAAWGSAALTGVGEPKQLSVGHIGANLLPMLGVQPVLGRLFLADEEGAGDAPAARVVLLSFEIWQRRFGGDKGLLGNTVMLDDEPHEVVGVLPLGFRLESKYLTDWDRPDNGFRDVWVPIGQAGSELQRRGVRFDVFGRLQPGVSVAQARAEAQNILQGGDGSTDPEVRVAVRKDVVTRGYGKPLLLAFGAAGLLLAIACANMASLLIGEAVERRREIATRLALGAGLGRITRQLLTESVFLGLLGAALGALIAHAGLQALISLAPPIPRLEEVRISLTVLLFAVSSGVIAGLIFGFAPMGLVARHSLKGAMVGGVRGTTSVARSFQGKTVTLQVALSAVLLVVGGLFARSLFKLIDVNPGFDSENLAVLQINAPASRYQSDSDATDLFLEVVQGLEALPGVRNVSGSQGLPFPGHAHMNSAQILAQGEDGWFTVRRRSVLPTYHETIGIPLVAGRFLSASSAANAPREMVISQSLAESRWPSQSPLGASVSFWREEWTVVGVVADVRHTSLRTGGEPTFYVPLSRTPQRDFSIIVRAERDVTSMVPLLRETIWSVDSDLPIDRVRTMTLLLAESTAADRYRVALVVVFGALATLLAGAGVFGVTANMVAQRTREIGIRTALGAQQTSVLGLVVRSSLCYALVGSVIGLLAALVCSHLIASYLFGVERWDPLTYAGVAALLLLVALTASFVPARRAINVDAIAVLCEE